MRALDLYGCRWIEGDALDLPFTDCYFDAVTVGYGLRNVVDKPKAMREIFRVLKPGLVQIPKFFFWLIMLIQFSRNFHDWVSLDCRIKSIYSRF